MYVEKRPGNVGNTMKPPSLVDLCVRTAIINVRYLGDVGETDSDLLARILPHCTVDQLMHVEKSTIGRDLSPITDNLWKNFYQKQFGIESVNSVIKNMKVKKASFGWRQLYEAKLKVLQEAEDKTSNRLKELYKNENARNGPGYNLSNCKSNIMKKAKLDLLKSQEVKNLTALRRKAVQGQYSGTSMTKSSGLNGKNSASTSRQTKPFERRF
ncbi:RNA polymerase II transcription factor SIII, subunit A [Corchorus olitorius]|uniref:RNA polymerase II transcription factor SIII, subunit A n=1 Tax=Corchorus olitorius TaxID=93759 RepID=A0A1R3GS07_9ROSI|nr:RNA polymerase II transcription factor SIII, subunit A [Corchorus olitorius]